MRAVVGLALVFGALVLFWYAVSPDSFKARFAKALSAARAGAPAPTPTPGRSPTGRNQQ